MECFEVRGLTFFYPEQKEKALNDLTFSVRQGEFIVLVGPSGCGKTTLLRQFKTVLAPHGFRQGEILFAGRPLSTMDQREQSSCIGFVQQNPDNQIVTDKVWHELAFGLESLGCDTPAIRGRVAEIASFFGIQTWFYKNVTELSGGQKQLLNLASIMAMQPSVLILDEPTSQLDPIAAADFLATVGKINKELGTTVIMTEHRLEEVFPMSDRVIVMDQGQIICDGPPPQVGEELKDSGHSMFLSMPAPMRIYAAVPNSQKCPITVRDGRLWLDEFAAKNSLKIPDRSETRAEQLPQGGLPVIELADIWFKYDRELPDVLKGLSLQVFKGEFLAVLGGNGTGKTTMLSLVSGMNKPYRGKVLLKGKELSEYGDKLFAGFLGVLPQNPQALFVKKTVREDLLEIIKKKKFSPEEKSGKIAAISRLCRLDELLERHPYDLSGGEQQRAALAKVLLLDPSILLLDEPTKGLDAGFKQVFAEILKSLLRHGVTVIMVSHDIEFCAKYAHRCAMFFDGTIVAEDVPRAFFSGNSFYTTSASRMARHLLPEAVTAEDVIAACGGSVPEVSALLSDDDGGYFPEVKLEQPKQELKKLPLWRKVIAAVAGAVVLVTFLHSIELINLTGIFGNGYGVYIVLVVALSLLAIAISKKSDRPIAYEQVPVEKRKLSKRTMAAAGIILLAIPLTIFIGVYYFGDRKYYFISLLVVLETLLPFFLVFEGRRPQARELIIIAVLCSLGVAGRAALFMLPEFKPVWAIAIISGVAFGGETGFIVGAITMLVSNIMFSQGPWTPWQMFSMGIIGFLAGVLFKKGLLQRNRLSLSVFGGLAALIVYGGIMNPASAIMWQSKINRQIILAYFITGFPVDLIHAAATVFFLWFISQPLLEKLDRIKMKYGLIEP